jgi:hypothetical protein
VSARSGTTLVDRRLQQPNGDKDRSSSLNGIGRVRHDPSRKCSTSATTSGNGPCLTALGRPGTGPLIEVYRPRVLPPLPKAQIKTLKLMDAFGVLAQLTRTQVDCFMFRAPVEARRIALNNHQGDGLPKHIRRTTKSRDRAPASRLGPARLSAFERKPGVGNEAP